MNPSGNRQSPELRPFDNDVVQQTMTNIDHLNNNPNLLLDSDIARMWEIVQVWKLNPNRDARFAELAGKFETAYNNLSDERRAVITRTREQLRRERERNTPQSQRQPSQTSRTATTPERQNPVQPQSTEEPIRPERQISVEQLPTEMKKLTSKIKKITENGIVDIAELSSLDYSLLIQVIVQAHGIEGELSDDLYKSLQDLESSLQELDRLYLYRRNNDSNFPIHEKYEKFRIDAIKSVFRSTQEYLGSFIDSMKGKNLAKLLIAYKQIKESNNVVDKEAKIMFLSDYIIREFILKNENYRVIFGKSGKIEVVTTEWDAEKKEFKKVSDNEVKKILDTLDEKDLKRHALSEIIDKENPGNEATVNKILRKYNIKNAAIGDLTFRDIKFEDPENCPVKKSILERLEKPNLTPEEFSDLSFVLDFINKRGSGYDTETMAAAYTLKVFVEEGFKAGGDSGILSAFNDPNRSITNELLSGAMTLNGGLVGIALVIAFIVGIFKKPMWTLGILGGIVGVGALEDLAKRTGVLGGDRDAKPWANNIDRVSNQFRGVDISIKNLPANFKGKYEELFKQNAENVKDGIEPQTYAQLFAQIGKNSRFLSYNIEEIKTKVDGNASLNDIFGEGNIPTEYLPDLIENKSNQPNLSRKIQEEEVRKFLKMLINSKEQGDVSIVDIFVPGKLESITYLRDEYFNEKISDVMTGFPLFDPVRNSIEQIFTLNLDNTNTIQQSIEKLNRLAEHNNDKRDKIEELVKVLEQMKKFYSYKEEADKIIEAANKQADKNIALDSIKRLIEKFERELEESENIEDEEYKEKVKKMLEEQINRLKLEYQKLMNKNIKEIIQKLEISENSIPAIVGMLSQRIKEIKVMIDALEDTVLKNECLEMINEKIDKLIEAFISKLSKAANPEEAQGIKESYDVNNIKDLGRGDKFTEVYNERLANINNFKVAINAKAFGDEIFGEIKRGELINLILGNESLKEFLVAKEIIVFNQSGQAGYVPGKNLGQVIRLLAEYASSNNSLRPNIEGVMKRFFAVFPEYNEGLKDIISKTGGETSFILTYSI